MGFVCCFHMWVSSVLALSPSNHLPFFNCSLFAAFISSLGLSSSREKFLSIIRDLNLEFLFRRRNLVCLIQSLVLGINFT